MTSHYTATALRETLDAAGAVFETESSFSPAHFGYPVAELERLRTGVGLIDLSRSVRISHRGPDALDLLHRLTTNDLLSLEPGRAVATAITSDRGRIIDVITVAAKASDDLLLLSDATDAAPAMEFIDRYTIIEAAELADLAPKTARLVVIGPDAPLLIKAVTGADIEQGSVAAAEVSGVAADAVRLDWAQLPRIDLVCAIADAIALWDALTAAGAAPVGEHAFHTARIQQGVPFPGAELTDRWNPLEAGLESVVSFTKGCYIGQEVIARLDSYDKLQRRLTGLVSASGLTAGSELSAADGKRAGEITSVAPLKVNDETLALGLVRKGSWDEGTELRCGDASVTVKALPFAD